jgi:uncharacterized membrane protein required for colicin V production
MITLDFFFYFMIVFFAIVGSMRGWAKEMLVGFSVILAVFIVSILESLMPSLIEEITRAGETAYFWVRTLLLFILVFFGYQTPNIQKLGPSKFARERLQDTLLGAILGGVNGFLVIGTLWYYMHTSGYPFQPKILPPNPDDFLTQDAYGLIIWLAPTWLRGPLLYVIIALAFLFVLVVLI